MRRYLDTSVIVRFLTGEPPEQAEAARALFAAAAEGRVELVAPAVIVVETGLVLLRVLRVERAETVSLLASLLECPGIVFEQRDVLWRMLEIVREHDVPLVDAYLAAFAAVRGGDPGGGLPVVASFDRHFDGLPGVRRGVAVIDPDQDTRGLGTGIHQYFADADADAAEPQTDDVHLPERSIPRAPPDFSSPDA